ncbi:MAG: thioredoxin family protein [Spirochaetaceae bacterium]|nr:thioredoxin family protein [Spirochaetaceae bacterium]
MSASSFRFFTATVMIAAGLLAAGLSLSAQAMMKLQPSSGGGVGAMSAPVQKPGAAQGSGTSQGGATAKVGAVTARPRRAFTTLDEARAMAAKKPTYLFFSASWCPTCRSALKEIDARAKELEEVAILIVDYDRSAELKKRYGIVSQHSFVRIDPTGTVLAAWNGGGVDEILANASGDGTS